MTTPFVEIMEWEPHGILLSNGPGRPECHAKERWLGERRIVAAGLPVFGICLGHQLIGREPWHAERKRCTTDTVGSTTRSRT